jgi:dihydroorotase-like cyclic amidohydrolase
MRVTNALLLLLLTPMIPAQEPVSHGRRYERLLIRNVHIIDGNGSPMTGPTDVVVEGDRIARVGGAPRGGAASDGKYDAVLEGEGRYLMPGMVNLHGHLQDSRPGSTVAMPFEYQLNLWLACGITTVRDLGSDSAKTFDLRTRSAAGELPAPRLVLHAVVGGGTVEAAVKAVDKAKERGFDGLKLFAMDREPLAAVLARAHELGLPVAHHIGVGEADAWDDIRGAVTTIEHWYGIPDAAIPYGSQDFPADYNYSNELDRFRWAGRLWKEADPAYLSAVLQGMVDAGVAWDPTLSIYVACRDVTRARNQPWFEDYLHPALEQFFAPDPKSHGSFFLEWTTRDEIEWKRNYEHWFGALREFAERGGTIGTGEDAGYIYQIYGFGFLRELELQQEAGFHPLDVVKHATGNGARILGLQNEIGRVKAGYKADLVLVNGNPLENFKRLYPTGTDEVVDGKHRIGGRVAWTIRDGYCYEAEVLLARARELVRQARAEVSRKD